MRDIATFSRKAEKTRLNKKNPYDYSVKWDQVSV